MIIPARSDGLVGVHTYCHCCGRGCGETEALYRVAGGADTGLEPVWSCEKHIGRFPCRIEGCGRTWALKAGDTYHDEVICGRHWRLAPKYMRDVVARVRRLARRLGWDDVLISRYNRLWARCFRAAQEAARGNIDIAEIERLFG